VIFSVADPAVDTGQPVEMQDDKISVDGRKGAPQALVRAAQRPLRVESYTHFSGWRMTGSGATLSPERLPPKVRNPPFCDIAEGFYILCFCTLPNFSSVSYKTLDIKFLKAFGIYKPYLSRLFGFIHGFEE
jgi:hypothetical protein